MFVILIIELFIASSVLMGWYLLRHDNGRDEPKPVLWAAFSFGIFAIFIAMGTEIMLLPNLDEESLNKMSIIILLATSLGIGFIEELAKFVPLAIFIKNKGYFNEYSDGVIYFGICGLGFGLIEHVMYTITGGSGTGIIRLIINPFFHAASTGILGYYLISSKLSRSYTKLILSLFLIPILHGMYNFGLFSQIAPMLLLSIMITLLLLMGLFLYLMRANDFDNDRIKLHRRRKNYCPNCGTVNIRQTSFCEKCGAGL